MQNSRSIITIPNFYDFLHPTYFISKLNSNFIDTTTWIQVLVCCGKLVCGCRTHHSWSTGVWVCGDVCSVWHCDNLPEAATSDVWGGDAALEWSEVITCSLWKTCTRCQEEGYVRFSTALVDHRPCLEHGSRFMTPMCCILYNHLIHEVTFRSFWHCYKES